LAIINFFDTSALLGGYKLAQEDRNIISPIVFEELETIKTSSTKDEATKYKARSLIRYLMSHRDLWETCCLNQTQIDKILYKTNYLPDSNDSRLICEAEIIAEQNKRNIYFITSDASQYLLANNFKKLYSTYWKDTSHKESLWKGYQEVELDDDRLSCLYSNPEINLL